MSNHNYDHQHVNLLPRVGQHLDPRQPISLSPRVRQSVDGRQPVNLLPRVGQHLDPRQPISLSPRVRQFVDDRHPEVIEAPRECRRDDYGHTDRHRRKHHNDDREKDKGHRPPEKALAIRDRQRDKDDEYSQSDRNAKMALVPHRRRDGSEDQEKRGHRHRGENKNSTKHRDDREKRRSDRQSKPIDGPQNSSGREHRGEYESQNGRRGERRRLRSPRRHEETQRYHDYPEDSEPEDPHDIRGPLPSERRVLAPSPPLVPSDLPSDSGIIREIEGSELRAHKKERMLVHKGEEEEREILLKEAKEDHVINEMVSRFVEDTQKALKKEASKKGASKTKASKKEASEKEAKANERRSGRR